MSIRHPASFAAMPLFAALSTFAAGADGTPPLSPDAFAGAWTFDAVRSAAATNPGSAHQHGAGRHSGGGMGGTGGGGMGGGHGGGGGQHHHDRGSAPVATSGSADDKTLHDRGLERIHADHLAISTLAKPARIRFDDGTTPVDLGLDGMNVSGPGVGGTLALSSTTPDLVVDSVTDSGYSLSERYHLIDDGRHLELHVSLRKSGADSASDTVRVFDRDAVVVAPKS
jgi:hypothetical protein